MTQDYLNTTYHHKIVRLSADSATVLGRDLPDKEYIVTGCLLKDDVLMLGLMATDFKPGTGGWHAIPLCAKCAPEIDKALIVDRDYDPITAEALTWVGDVEIREDGHPYAPIKRRLIWRGDERTPWGTSPLKGSVMQSNDIIYEVQWTNTENALCGIALQMHPVNFEGKTDEQVQASLESVRGWIRAGMYYHQDRPEGNGVAWQP